MSFTDLSEYMHIEVNHVKCSRTENIPDYGYTLTQTQVHRGSSQNIVRLRDIEGLFGYFRH